MAIVETRKIQKHYGDVRAVDGIDLCSGEGEFLVLLGPSGCGKTTLLRMIAGLEQPTAGEVLINGQVVNGFPPRVRGIAMVFQSYALYPHMSVFDNIAFPLKAQGMAGKIRKQKVQRAASALGIENLLGRKPRQLSGGERQRVALARALVREPTVFLLDEPLSNLDAQLRSSARDELQRLQQSTGITTIYVTHDQVEAMGMGDRIAVINQGKIRQLGTPRQIYDQPADSFVATFLGSPPMNLVESNGRLIGFRPEHFLPKGATREQDHLMSFWFTATRLEYLGADRLAYGVLGGAYQDTRTVARLPSTSTAPIEVGRSCEFVVKLADLRFFNRATGLRTGSQPDGSQID